MTHDDDNVGAQAMRIAAIAMTKIEGHITSCDRRYLEQAEVQKENKTSLSKLADTMSSSLSRIHDRIDTVLRSLTIAFVSWLLTVVAYLLVNGPPWLHFGGGK